MSIFKRISTTMVARLDRLVGAFENHDAVVEATLAEMRQSLAKARVYQARVRRDGEKLGEQLAAARDEERAWAERARAATDDESLALECLRRRRVCRERIGQLEKALTSHTSTEEKLAGDIRRAEQQLARLSEQRNLMRSRESTAEALNVASRAEASPDIDAAFERWAIRVTEAEMIADGVVPEDALRDRFEAEEDLHALREELAQLRQEGVRDEH